MKDINVYIEVDLKTPHVKSGHYGVVIEWKERQEIETLVEVGFLEKTTRKRLEVAAIHQAFTKIPQKSRVMIYTDSAYLQGAFMQEWLKGWQRTGWKNAKGKEIKNKDLWEHAMFLAGSNEISIVTAPKHCYSDWLKDQMEQIDLAPGTCRIIKEEEETWQKRKDLSKRTP